MDPDADPDTRILTSADPDPALFVGDLQEDNNKFSAFYFLRVHLHHSSKIKNHKEVTKQ
jgi:hypothetical protein